MNFKFEVFIFMKILHTSDWHLGKVIYNVPMIDDQKYFINEVLFKIICKENPDLLIISGDIFDRQIASLEAIKLFNEFLIKICKKHKIPVAIITGNHDSADRISVASELLKDNKVYIISHINDKNKIITLFDNDLKVNIALLPYFDLQTARSYFNEDELSLNEAYNKILCEIKENLNETDFNILVSHCFVTGSKNFKTDDNLSVGTIDEINNKLFDGFDYVALGHIHSSQNVNSHIRYSGAPLKYSFDEPDKSKTISLIEIKDKSFKVEEIKIVPRHNMRTIKGKFNEIISQAKTNPSNDYICVELTDDMPIYMPMPQLRVYYPNILTVKSEWIKNINSENSENILKNKMVSCNEKNEKYVFTQFLKEICNVEPEKDDYNIFEEICEKLEKEE